jgi:hypothetical protein
LTFQPKTPLTVSNVLNYRAVMTPKSQLQTIDEVIHALGGPKVLCNLFGGVPSRWSNYKAAGRFPDAMHMRVYVECVKRGVPIAPELVGMTEDELAIAQGRRQTELRLQAAE